MAILIVLTYEDNRILEGQDYRLTVVDGRRMEKIPLMKALRKMTGANLKSSKRAIETLQSSKDVIFKATIDRGAEQIGAGTFEALGVHLTEEIGMEIEPDDFDYEGQRRQRLASLIERLPTLPVREDPTCEQLADLMMVAHRLGMHGAAEALEAWRKSVDLAKEPGHYYTPIG